MNYVYFKVDCFEVFYVKYLTIMYMIYIVLSL